MTTQTNTTPELISVCRNVRPHSNGWIPGHVRLHAVPAVGSKVQIVSALGSGHVYGTGTVVESARVLNDGHPIARLRTLQGEFAVDSDFTEERYGKQVPAMRFYVEFRLANPVNEYDLSREQAYDLLPEWAQVNCKRSV